MQELDLTCFCTNCQLQNTALLSRVARKLYFEVVQANTQGCRLGDKHRVHDRLARHIQSNEHIAVLQTVLPEQGYVSTAGNMLLLEAGIHFGLHSTYQATAQRLSCSSTGRSSR